MTILVKDIHQDSYLTMSVDIPGSISTPPTYILFGENVCDCQEAPSSQEKLKCIH